MSTIKLSTTVLLKNNITITFSYVIIKLLIDSYDLDKEKKGMDWFTSSFFLRKTVF